MAAREVGSHWGRFGTVEGNCFTMVCIAMTIPVLVFPCCISLFFFWGERLGFASGKQVRKQVEDFIFIEFVEEF